MKTEVIIVAGGLGKRLKARVFKAFVALKEQALFVHSLKVFNKHPAIDGIIVVGVKEHLRLFARFAFPYKKVRAVVSGGKMRSDSVKCGLKELSSDTDLVLVHDAARPFVDAGMIDRLINALGKSKAAIVGVPVKSTIKKINRKSLDIEETLPRDVLWEAQTPQGFHKDVLVKAHARPIKQEATDDAMLVEQSGLKVKMVMGDYRNIKITTPEDLKMAGQLI
ncbi:MAG: 2-C-methyl-D-erythritol 4-phosphate cytidylyltransferase [Candidatus Omnitrophica bacterium]|nr:2-C-methyl-D-erythritol 4-phosphate cytidylyltransferase [Candidatus Omnitrophota bacterium]